MCYQALARTRLISRNAYFRIDIFADSLFRAFVVKIDFFSPLFFIYFQLQWCLLHSGIRKQFLLFAALRSVFYLLFRLVAFVVEKNIFCSVFLLLCVLDCCSFRCRSHHQRAHFTLNIYFAIDAVHLWPRELRCYFSHLTIPNTNT